ncbi:hypothetical protein COCNU_07G009870 [Cocos nucifera]|uniref:Uncharacterized protein n=1 Tax=Cocos nucifera TaxID=13894 RepID=A0A8K0N4M4_COCNU|nr:hypothetical protein COCNU_07G009870 [Cocos nucifera]
MKFGARKAKPTHEPVIEEAPTKKYEVLPRESGTEFGASRSRIINAAASPFNGSEGLGYKRSCGRNTSKTLTRSVKKDTG